MVNNNVAGKCWEYWAVWIRSVLVAKFGIQKFSLRSQRRNKYGGISCGLRRLFFLVVLNTCMISFTQYVAIREGLWLNDRNALPGMSRLNTLPKQPAKVKSAAPKPLTNLPPMPPRRGYDPVSRTIKAIPKPAQVFGKR